jgi:lysostaphin
VTTTFLSKAACGLWFKAACGLLAAALLPGQVRMTLPATVKQGHAARVEVFGADGSGYKIEANGKTVRLFRQEDGVQLGFLSISALEPPRVIEVTLQDPQGAALETRSIAIVNANFRIRNIVPSRTMSELKPSPGEIERAAELMNTVSDQKYWSEPFLAPTPNCVNSPFGVLSYLNGKPSGGYHRGVDLFSGAGTPVKATAAGIVKIAQTWNMQGGMIGIDHGQGVTSTYLHLSKVIAAEGQMVQRGDVVGLVGSTGFSTGPHLHFGLAVNGVPVNAVSWIPSMQTCGAAPARKAPARGRSTTPVKQQRK